MADEKAVTIQPVIGRDGKLLGVTLNGITCVRPDDLSWDEWAGSLLMRIVTYPRDDTSDVALALIAEDSERIHRVLETIPLDPT